MTFTKKNDGKKLTISVEGRVDTTTAPELQKAIDESIADADSLTLDLAEVSYISSAGLRVLLSAHKAMMKKDGMKITNAGADIIEIFEVTGFSDILNIV